MIKRWGAGLLTTRLILNLGSSRIQQQLFHSIILGTRKITCIRFNHYLSILQHLPMVIIILRATPYWTITIKMSLRFTILWKRIHSHIWAANSSLLGVLLFQILQRKTKIRIILQIYHQLKRPLKDIWHHVGRIRYQDKVKSNKMMLFLSPLSRAWEIHNNSSITSEIITHSPPQITTYSTSFSSRVVNSQSKQQTQTTSTPNTSWLMTSMGRLWWVRLPTQPIRPDTMHTTINSRWWRLLPYTRRMTPNHYKPMLL